MAFSLALGLRLAAGLEALSRGRDAPLASEGRWRQALASELSSDPVIREATVMPDGMLQVSFGELENMTSRAGGLSEVKLSLVPMFDTSVQSEGSKNPEAYDFFKELEKNPLPTYDMDGDYAIMLQQDLNTLVEAFKQENGKLTVTQDSKIGGGACIQLKGNDPNPSAHDSEFTLTNGDVIYAASTEELLKNSVFVVHRATVGIHDCEKAQTPMACMKTVIDAGPNGFRTCCWTVNDKPAQACQNLDYGICNGRTPTGGADWYPLPPGTTLTVNAFKATNDAGKIATGTDIFMVKSNGKSTVPRKEVTVQADSEGQVKVATTVNIQGYGAVQLSPPA